MGLRSFLVGRAVRAARVLLVESPGAWEVRVAAERAVEARGWRLADTPATADVLLVAGRLDGGLEDVVERLWDALPGPRARAEVVAVTEVATALDGAARTLADGGGQRRDAEAREAERDVHAAPHHSGVDDAGMDHGGTEHVGMDPGDMDHGDMDHGDMDMAPGGIPLAEGSADDRDGLEMDALPVRLGPVLPAWPAGLVLEVVLHGDLVVEATARLLGAVPDTVPSPDAATAAARRVDDVAAVLTLLGWEDAARAARSARDVVLDRRGDDGLATLTDLRHRIGRSRSVRWSLAGAGPVTAERAAALGVPDLAGDCRDRLLVLLARAEAAARAYRAEGPRAPAPAVPTLTPAAVAGLVAGLDLGVARLVVASLGSETVVAEVAADA